jgi:GT2 family glycosyltransferase
MAMSEQRSTNLLCVSIIIPTYNRRDSLRAVLHSLAGQTYPPDRYEVIVVDDGSSDGTEELFAPPEWLITVRYFKQSNKGPAAARNLGVRHARGELVIFLDDDIVVEPYFLEEHLRYHTQYDRAIVLGFSKTAFPEHYSPFSRCLASSDRNLESLSRHVDECGFLSGAYCMAGNMSIKRAEFIRLGAFTEDLLASGTGWSGWEDVEFGWRAEKAGVRTVYNPKALGYHHDYSAVDFKASCRRWMVAASTAARLFARHPDLEEQIPMFRDKGYISLQTNPPRIIVRKVLRGIVSWQPILWLLEQVTHQLERRFPRPFLLRPLYRWIIGSYIFRGYRQGLREYAHRI